MIIPDSLYDVETRESNRLQNKEKSVEGQESSVSMGLIVQAVLIGSVAVTSVVALLHL